MAEHREKNYIALSITQIVMIRLLIEIWTFEVLLLRVQKKVRNVLLESKGREILISETLTEIAPQFKENTGYKKVKLDN